MTHNPKLRVIVRQVELFLLAILVISAQHYEGTTVRQKDPLFAQQLTSLVAPVLGCYLLLLHIATFRKGKLLKCTTMGDFWDVFASTALQ